MHIALISPLPPEQNGIADYAEAFQRALEIEGVTVSTPLASPCQPTLLRQRMAAADWSRFDLVHAELGGGRSREFLALEWLLKHHPDLALTATVHDPERLVWKSVALPPWVDRLPRLMGQALVLMADPWTLARERSLARRLAKVVTLTRMGAEHLRRRMKLAPGQVHCIPHGNQRVPESPMPALPPDGTLKILYFGFIYRGKGIEDLIDAVAWLNGKRSDLGVNLELTLAGGTRPSLAFDRGGSYLDELRDRWQRAGLGKVEVHWELDVKDERIPALIQAHHVMVLPYRDSARLAWLGQMYGTSGALSWAAACGRSVISSDARAFTEEVSYGNGAVYPQGNPPALGRELERLLDEPTRIIEQGRQAARVGEERCWSHVAAAFRGLFEREISRRKAA